MEDRHSEEQVHIPEDAQSLGNVIIEFDKGITIRWAGQAKNKPTVADGDRYLLALRNNPVMKIEIGSDKELERPVQYRWVQDQRRPLVTPDKEGPIILRVYPLPKQASGR